MPEKQHNGLRQDGGRFSSRKTITLKETKPKAWSHQADLAAAIGKTVGLEIIGQTGLRTGTLVAADQFSLKVRFPNKAFAVVIYKSALTSFEVQG